MLRGDRFRVKLNALDRQLAMLKPHNRAILKLCGDFKAIRKAFALNNQRMIPGGVKWCRQTCKNAFAVVMHLAHLAMHDLMTPGHSAAKSLADGLMPQADAHQRRFGFRCGLNQRQADTRLIWCSGAGRQENPRRLHRHGFLGIDRIVAPDLNIRPQFAQIMDEVVGETVIVID